MARQRQRQSEGTHGQAALRAGTALCALALAALWASPAAAECSDNTPSTDGQDVVCDTAPPNPDRDGVVGDPDVDDVDVTILPGAVIDPPSNFGGFGVLGRGTGWSVLNQGHIDAVSFGVALGFGGEVTNEAGGRIFGFDAGITVEGSPGTIVNRGTVTSEGGNAAQLLAGGTITNGGLLQATGSEAGVVLVRGGTVTNLANGRIEGDTGVGAIDPADIVNDGIIRGRRFSGVLLFNGGTVTNRGGALIEGGEYGVSDSGGIAYFSLGANGGGEGPSGPPIDATIVNEADGRIVGRLAGIQFFFTRAQIDNAGTIVSGQAPDNDTAVYGIALRSGGEVINREGGLIRVTGTSNGDGILIAGGAGLVRNAGTIISGTQGCCLVDHGVRFLAGGSLVNEATGFIAASGFAVRIEGGVGDVVNRGQLRGLDAGVRLEAGGTIVNEAGGLIDSVVVDGLDPTGPAIDLRAGGAVRNGGEIFGFRGIAAFGDTVVENLAGGAIRGTEGSAIDHVGGTIEITNAGLIETGPGFVPDFAISLLESRGTIVNAEGGQIIGSDGGVVARSRSGTPAPDESVIDLVNAGEIAGNSGQGVILLGGSVTNEATGTITGGSFAAVSLFFPGAIDNAGAISGTEGVGVLLVRGGTLLNREGGEIVGLVDGVSASGATELRNESGATITGSGGVGVRFEGDFADLFENLGDVNGDVLLGGGDDRAVLTAGQSISGLLDGGGGEDALVLDGAAGSAAALDLSPLASFETGEKRGDGTWTFTGANDALDTDFTIAAGTLVADADAPSIDMTVAAGARLEGTGTLGSLAAEGAVAPGGSLGTLTIAGDAIFAAGSTFLVEVAADGSGDRLEVGGAATIDGGTVAVTALDPDEAYVDGTVWTILVAQGGVAGTFDGLTSSSAFLDFTLGYDTDMAFLTLALVRTFPDVALTFNQRQASTALMTLDQIPGSDALAVYNAILMLGEDEARAAFDAASGEIYASLLAGAAGTGQARVRRLVSRGHAPHAEGWGLWGGINGRDSSLDGDGNGAGVDQDEHGFELGIDYRGPENGWAAGAAVGYVDGGLDVDGRGSTAAYDGWHLGAYARIGTGHAGFTAAGAADYARTEADVRRTVAVGALSRGARADVEIGSLSLAGELRYGLALGGGWATGPVASIQYADADFGRVVETGAGSLGLSSDGASDDIVRFGGGLFLNRQGPRGGIDISAQYIDGRGDGAEVPLRLAGAPGAVFAVRSPGSDGAAGLFAVAGRHALGGGWTIAAGARALVGADERSVAGWLTVGRRF